MKRIVTLPIIALLFAACGEKEESSQELAPVSLSDDVKVTTFTATVSVQFNGISYKDLEYGSRGLLYCEDGANADLLFQAWRNGEKNSDCKVFTQGSTTTSGQYEATLTNLSPDTEYAMCVFFKSEDGSRIEMSGITHFKTNQFAPDMATGKATGIKHYSATVDASIITDKNDLNLCTPGMALSMTSDMNSSETSFILCELSNDGKMKVDLNNLKVGATYYYCPYLKVKLTGETAFGPVETFSTLSAEDMKVDFGLPSGILWADRDLGAESWNEYGVCYAWGMLKSYGTYHNITADLYDFMDKNTPGYTDIGNEISGTGYDVAHYYLGGKWRMPTKDDFVELIEHTTWSWYRSGKNEGTADDSYSVISNGTVSMKMGDDRRWTGTVSDETKVCRNEYWTADVKPIWYFWGIFSEESDMSDMNYILDKLKTIVVRELECAIRPVWDPNMQ